MAKLPYIELANGLKIPILHEDRNVIAIDKPQGWMLAPVSWQNTARNLFAALTSSVSAGDFWAKSRNLRFIRFVHRLDADTSGVLLLVKAPGALPAFTELFEDRKVQKVYLAVVTGVPEVVEWKCRLRLAPMQDRAGLMEVNNAQGKDSETLFRVIDKRADRALVMCWPLTGRTHQIRLHLAAVGHPVWGDELYGKVPTTTEEKTDLKLGLRSISLSYKDPFMAEEVSITADTAAFVKAYGLDAANQALSNLTPPGKALEHPKARLEETRLAEKAKRKQQRDEQRESRPPREFSDDRPRNDWQQDEDSGGFATEPSRDTGERPFRPRTPREFDRGPRRPRGEAPYRSDDRDAGAPRRRYDDRPQRPAGAGRSFGGPRKFEGREGGFERKPFGGGYRERGARQGGYGRMPAGGEYSGGGRDRSFGDRPARPGFGRKDYPVQRDFERGERGYPGQRPGGFNRSGAGDERRSGGGGFRGGPGGKPGYGRPYENRDQRRPFDKGRSFNHGPHERDARGERLQTRPGVFQSSAQGGLKAGFQSSGFGPRSDRRLFRSATAAARPQGKFGGGKPRSGGGNRSQRGYGRGPR